ncbi:MAG: hypothetical protein ACXVPL_00720 [Actinomycetota bacterium]
MPDLEDRLPDLLRDLSTDAPAEPASTPMLGRAKRRRIRTGAGAVVVVVLLGTVSAIGLGEVNRQQPHRAGGSESTVAPPSPSFRGIWPETTEEQLSAAQAQVDAGHTPLRTDAKATAAELATTLFGWEPGDVQFDRTSVDQDYALVELSNRMFGDLVPPIDVQLEQLGRRGSEGIWSVVSVSTTLIDGITLEMSANGSVTVSGTLTSVFDGSTVHIDVLTGATNETSAGGTIVQLGSLRGGTFTATVPTSGVDQGPAIVWIRVVEATGATLDATAVPLRDLVDGRYPAAAPVDVPPAVESTVEQLVHAVGGVDIPALQLLMDPNTFSYNADDGSNPVVLWKEDPSVLDPILSILTLPPAEPKQITGYGTFYVWPYLVDSDFANLTPAEVDDLHMLGFDDAAIEQMVKDGRYTGPRLSIDENGLWTSYSTGGNH